MNRFLWKSLMFLWYSCLSLWTCWPPILKERYIYGFKKTNSYFAYFQQVMLVREENLASAKSKLKDVKSIHVYSVQKTKLPDMSVLYTANYDKVKENILTINKWVVGNLALIVMLIYDCANVCVFVEIVKSSFICCLFSFF